VSTDDGQWLLLILVIAWMTAHSLRHWGEGR
jgi:hypothetical protein